MPQKVKIKAILKKARQIRAAWKANPEFEMGDMRLSDFIAILEAAESVSEEYSKRRVELTGLKHTRDIQVRELNRLATRFRSGIVFRYGADSPQYAQSGATRTSERKPRKRKSK